MNTIMPIIIPIEPSQCPECGKPEDIKKVCRHCGHEYRDGSAWGVLRLILGTVVALWVMLTIGYWLIEQGDDETTLLDVLKGQGEFLRGLRIW